MSFSYPEYAEINGKKYKINTDYRIAIQCDAISKDETIEDTERGLAIIYLLFGKEALEDISKNTELVVPFSEKAMYFLKCGDMSEDDDKEEPDFDLVQDFPYIVISIKGDYNGKDITKGHTHWWDFYYMLMGLSESEMGNSCVFNKIRDLRNRDLSKITDHSEREKVRKAQEKFALKKHKKEKEFTEEELKNMEEFYNS